MLFEKSKQHIQCMFIILARLTTIVHSKRKIPLIYFGKRSVSAECWLTLTSASLLFKRFIKKANMKQFIQRFSKISFTLGCHSYSLLCLKNCLQTWENKTHSNLLKLGIYFQGYHCYFSANVSAKFTVTFWMCI